MKLKRTVPRLRFEECMALSATHSCAEFHQRLKFLWRLAPVSAATSLLRCLECRKTGLVLASYVEWTALYLPYLPVVILHKTSPAGLAKQLYTAS